MSRMLWRALLIIYYVEELCCLLNIIAMAVKLQPIEGIKKKLHTIPNTSPTRSLLLCEACYVLHSCLSIPHTLSLTPYMCNLKSERQTSPSSLFLYTSLAKHEWKGGIPADGSYLESQWYHHQNSHFNFFSRTHFWLWSRYVLAA